VAALLIFGPVCALAVGALHGLGNGIMTIVRGTLPLSLFGQDGYGRRQGRLLLPSGIMHACGPFLFSLCIAALGKNALLVYLASCAAAAALFCLLNRIHSHSKSQVSSF
jgi:hypothetical protein